MQATSTVEEVVEELTTATISALVPFVISGCFLIDWYICRPFKLSISVAFPISHFYLFRQFHSQLFDGS